MTGALVFGVGAVLFILGTLLGRARRRRPPPEMSDHAATLAHLRDLQRRPR
jgi:hypothetical protein